MIPFTCLAGKRRDHLHISFRNPICVAIFFIVYRQTGWQKSDGEQVCGFRHMRGRFGYAQYSITSIVVAFATWIAASTFASKSETSLSMSAMILRMFSGSNISTVCFAL